MTVAFGARSLGWLKSLVVDYGTCDYTPIYTIHAHVRGTGSTAAVPYAGKLIGGIIPGTVRLTAIGNWTDQGDIGQSANLTITHPTLTNMVFPVFWANSRKTYTVNDLVRLECEFHITKLI